MVITLERLEEVLKNMKETAVKLGFNPELESLEDARSIDEAYHLGRIEQIESFIEEADEDGAEKLYNKYASKGEGH